MPACASSRRRRPKRSLPVPAGIAPAELAARARRGTAGIAAQRLQQWLIGEGFAVMHDGLLVPTQRTRELAWTS
jgi:hypothetical protein